MSDVLLTQCHHADVCHDILNPSKHSPVMVEMELNATRNPTRPATDPKRQINWARAEPFMADYHRELDARLMQRGAYSVETCQNVACTAHNHLREIDRWCTELIGIALSSDRGLPRKRGGRPVVSGWNEHVREYREECLFWGALWKASDRTDDWLFEQMKDAKRQYHYAVRRVKRRERILKGEKFAEAIADNRSRDFFAEVKRMNPKSPRSPCVDGLCDEYSIAEHFSAKYQELFNSVASDGIRLSGAAESIQSGAKQCEYADHVIGTADVRRAIQKLRHEKRDGDQGLISSHLKHCTEAFMQCLADLFTCMYVHGHQAAPLLNATIVPIPKDGNKSMADANNYRGIALSSSIAKVFDLVFLRRNEISLKTSNLQFAFKKDFSTTMCTLAMKEVALHYLNRDSDVFSCFLDATKAFDRVRFDCLFEILIERGVKWPDLRMLLDLYQHQCARVSWGAAHSSYFSVSNGIRQGSIISPVLFAVYMDPLIDRLRRSEVGCWVGHAFYGAMIYADDITLLSPSVSGLRQMLKVCEEFCAERGITFNATKSICMRFRPSWKREAGEPLVEIGGVPLKWTNCVRHLGNYVSHDLSEQSEVNRKRGDIFGRVNAVLANFANMPRSVISRILNTQCFHFYGCQAWWLMDANIDRMITAVNRSIRRALKLHPRTHRFLLPALTGSKPIEEQLIKRCRRMIDAMKCCGNEISLLCRMCEVDSASIIASNKAKVNSYVRQLSTDEEVIIQALFDLESGVVGFDREEADFFFELLCIS